MSVFDNPVAVLKSGRTNLRRRNLLHGPCCTFDPVFVKRDLLRGRERRSLCTMWLSPLSEIDRRYMLIDNWAPSTGDREGSAWRKNLWVGRVRGCTSRSIRRSVGIDPAGFIPPKVNSARPSVEESAARLAREQRDKSHSLLYSSLNEGCNGVSRLNDC